MAAVKVSHTPSTITLTLVARNAPVVARRRRVGVDGVGDPDVARVAHAGVLPVRDAVSVQARESRAQCALEFGGCRGGEHARDMPHRTLVQDPDGLTRRVALDA